MVSFMYILLFFKNNFLGSVLFVALSLVGLAFDMVD